MKCSIIGCGLKKWRYYCDKITFHRLPRGEKKRKQWLSIIGEKNIKPHIKDIFICSLHFEESCFNRTMEMVRLRDEAFPTKLLPPNGQINFINVKNFNNQKIAPKPEIEHNYCAPISGPEKVLNKNSASAVIKHKTTKPLKMELDLPNEAKILSIEFVPNDPLFLSDKTIKLEHNSKGEIKFDRLSVGNMGLLEEKLQNLQVKYKKRFNIIKRLRERTRRQSKNIEALTNTIHHLKKELSIKNDFSNVLEELNGADFLKRHFLKSKGMRFDKEYSVETKLFAINLHLISPKAYNFIRMTYDNCLPHPRTLLDWKQNIKANIVPDFDEAESRSTTDEETVESRSIAEKCDTPDIGEVESCSITEETRKSSGIAEECVNGRYYEEIVDSNGTTKQCFNGRYDIETVDSSDIPEECANDIYYMDTVESSDTTEECVNDRYENETVESSDITEEYVNSSNVIETVESSDVAEECVSDIAEEEECVCGRNARMLEAMESSGTTGNYAHLESNKKQQLKAL